MFFKRKKKPDTNSIRNTFDAQKMILIEKEYPSMLGMSLEDFNRAMESVWKSFLEKNSALEIKISGNMPLLLVAGRCDTREQIKKIEGHTELDFEKLKNNGEDCLNPFYFLLDVEDGKKMVAKSAKDSLKMFEKEKRSALNLQESICLLTYHPELLKDHYLIVAGTFYKKDDEKLPLLWLLDEDGKPELHYAWFDIAHGSYGTASYAIRII
jgi:GTPase SAR1 family protein